MQIQYDPDGSLSGIPGFILATTYNLAGLDIPTQFPDSRQQIEVPDGTISQGMIVDITSIPPVLVPDSGE